MKNRQYILFMFTDMPVKALDSTRSLHVRMVPKHLQKEIKKKNVFNEVSSKTVVVLP